MADFFGAPDVLQLDELSSVLANSGSDICVCAALPVNDTAQAGEAFYLLKCCFLQGHSLVLVVLTLKILVSLCEY